MPIGTNAVNNFMSVNGEPSGLLLNSLDDDESFVVVQTERSQILTNDTSNTVTVPQETQTDGHRSFQHDCSFPVFNNMTRSGMSSSRMSNQSQMFSAHEVPTVDQLGLRFESQTVSVSPEEIEKRLQEVLLENINLKDNLHQTNLAMKQQLGTVALLQDRALEVQKNHTAKFEEVKALILKLTSEKNALLESVAETNAKLSNKLEECKELKEANVAFGSEVSRILAENDTLKKQLSSSQESLQAVQSTLDNSKKVSSQPSAKEVEMHSLVDQLTRKLEAVERAHRHQGFDLERGQAQLARAMEQVNQLQQDLAQRQAPPPAPVTETQQKTEDVNSNSPYFGEKTSKYSMLLMKLKASIEEEKARNNSLNSWISMSEVKNTAQFEISELRRLLVEEQSQSVTRKENLYHAVSTIQELLGDYQKLGENLERVKADHVLKESHGAVYDEMQRKGFTERIDSLTAILVEKEEALAVSERHLSSLQEAVRLQNEMKKSTEEVSTLKEQIDVLTKESVGKDEQLQARAQEINTHKAEVTRLQDELLVRGEQANIYKCDFEAERTARQALVGEKDRLMDDLRQLQRRNQDLIDERVTANPPPPPPTTITPTAPRLVGRLSSSLSRRPQQTPSPPPPRNNEILENENNGIIFHEKQDGYLCAQHCLNTLLQADCFNAVDLAELALEMDHAEKVRLVLDGDDHLSLKKNPSVNMDDTGYFSVQVISCALELWDLEMIPYNSSDPRAAAVRTDPGPASCKAFICNSHSHWYTVRRLGNVWFNLNSLLKEPEVIPDSYIGLFLYRLIEDGHSVFIVLGELPPCPADHLVLNLDPELDAILHSDKRMSVEDYIKLKNSVGLNHTSNKNDQWSFKNTLQLIFHNLRLPTTC